MAVAVSPSYPLLSLLAAVADTAAFAAAAVLLPAVLTC